MNGTKTSDKIAATNQDIAESSMASSKGLSDHSEFEDSKISGSTDTIMTDSQFHQKSSILLAQVASEKVPNNTSQYKRSPKDSQVNLSSTSDNSNSVDGSALSLKELIND